MIGIVIKKEFRQIFRNPNILRMMMVMPIIQLIIIPFAADYEIKNIDLAIVNQDNSSYSQRLVQKLVAGNYFQLVEAGTDYRTAQESIEKRHGDLIITIPHDIERNIIKENKATISIAAPGLSTQVRITRDELESALRPRIADTVQSLERAVAAAGLTMGDLAGIVLVGGSARVPLVAEMVATATGCTLLHDAD
ncbi:MAG TPA: Hsp70 family protein, partial [Saprospiraceae bacterium]|nr:Hsp70 family protein [Saprospiraceae bacterium]